MHTPLHIARGTLMSEGRSAYREKPRIDRDELQRIDRIERRCAQCWHELVQLLEEDEHPGTPLREGRVILIPVHSDAQDASSQEASSQDEAARTEDERALRTLVAAWLDDASSE